MANATKSKNGECGKCKTEFTKGKGNEGMHCDLCEEWFHLVCTDVPEVLYKAMSKYPVKAVKWLCDNCEKTFMESAAELKKKQESMEREMEKMGKEMVEMQNKMIECNNKLNERMNAFEAEMVGMKGEIREAERGGKEGRKVENQTSGRQPKADTVGREEGANEGEDNEGWQPVSRKRERDLQVQVVETMEREKRKNNVIIMGLSEEMDDKQTEDFIVEMMGTIVDADVHLKVHGRIGKKPDGDKKRPVKIEVRETTVRRTILQKAANLKKEQKYERIYVSPDLTKKQQEEDKTLRDKVKEFRSQGMEGVKINKGCVVREVQGGRKEILYNPNQ